MNNISKSYNQLPSWSKGIIAVVSIGAIAFVGYTVYSTIKKAKDIKNANVGGKEAEKELKELAKKGIIPSYSPSQFITWVQKLVEAISDCGTDEKTVYSVFENMKNKADILSLVASFGVQFYRPCASTQPISYAKYLFDNKSFGGSLSTFLQYDLSVSEIAKINKILESKKIDYKF
jgi:hypothetical protein